MALGSEWTRLCQAFILVPTLSSIEHGHQSIYVERVVQLAQALGVSTDYLLGLSETPEKAGEKASADPHPTASEAPADAHSGAGGLGEDAPWAPIRSYTPRIFTPGWRTPQVSSGPASGRILMPSPLRRNSTRCARRNDGKPYGAFDGCCSTCLSGSINPGTADGALMADTIRTQRAALADMLDESPSMTRESPPCSRRATRSPGSGPMTIPSCPSRPSQRLPMDG